MLRGLHFQDHAAVGMEFDRVSLKWQVLSSLIDVPRSLAGELVNQRCLTETCDLVFVNGRGNLTMVKRKRQYQDDLNVPFRVISSLVWLIHVGIREDNSGVSQSSDIDVW